MREKMRIEFVDLDFPASWLEFPVAFWTMVPDVAISSGADIGAGSGGVISMRSPYLPEHPLELWIYEAHGGPPNGRIARLHVIEPGQHVPEGNVRLKADAAITTY